MSTPSQPYSSELPICLSLARAPTPHPPGKDLVIFQARQGQRLAGHIHLLSALTTSAEPTLHLLALPILRSGCKGWSTDAQGTSAPTPWLLY